MLYTINLVALCLTSLPLLTTALPQKAATPYKLALQYDASNWFTSFTYENLPDPTNGTVDYVSLEEAQALGLTKIVNGNQVYMGVDNTTHIDASSSAGRKSIWIESKADFMHGILIGDFAHIPGSNCGSWPGFWTIRNGQGTYGEIDILESFSDNTQAFTTLHTGGQCNFHPPTSSQKGQANQDDFDCNLDTPGCSVIGPVGSYGDPFNAAGGGVYAMHWTSDFIRVYFFPRNAVPADITAGTPEPSLWGLPTANFDTQYGSCDLDANFPAQTIYFDTTFCGGNAGGPSWTSWTDCSAKTGVATCEEYVRTNPAAFTTSYWLVNSVKVYQQ